MDWIVELARVMPPPPAERRGTIPTEAQWRAVEDRLGVAIPPDYRAFVDAWGADGQIDGFFSYFTPVSAFDPLRLPNATERTAWAYSQMNRTNPARFPLPDFPAVGSLFPIGISDNGDSFGWIVGAGAPETWKVAWLYDEDGEPQVFDLSFGPFLHAVVSGTIRLDGLSQDVPLGFEWLGPTAP